MAQDVLVQAPLPLLQITPEGLPSRAYLSVFLESTRGLERPRTCLDSMLRMGDHMVPQVHRRGEARIAILEEAFVTSPILINRDFGVCSGVQALCAWGQGTAESGPIFVRNFEVVNFDGFRVIVHPLERH